jgi:hypothetical protein
LQVKVYLVQQPDGAVIAAKLRYQDAHAIAKAEAPCRVLFLMADKTTRLNPPASRGGSDGPDRNNPP